MKYWLGHLPLEVWVDCYRYPWISREELGRIVDRFRNRKFAEYLQFYLHDWGKRTLEPIFFRQQKHPNISVDHMRPYPFKAIPQTPMPSNIRSFKFIQINHFDQQTIDFLHQIQQLLLADTKFIIFGIEPWNLGNVRTILDYMVPLLGGIDELRCNVSALPVVQQCFGEKLTKINWIKAFCQEYEGLDEAIRQATINFLTIWLNPAQQADIGPKWCYITMWNDKDGFSTQICAAIREGFLAANSPCTFAVFVNPFFSRWEFAEFHLQNSMGEELDGVRIGHRLIQITRHRANCGTEMEEWIGANQSKSNNIDKHNQIAIVSPTIGPIDAMDVPDDVEENEEKPSTSKDT